MLKTQIKQSLKFIREAVLTPKQVRILTSKGFTVCFKDLDDWGMEIYAIYA